MNPGGQLEDSGIHSHTKTQKKTITNFWFLDLSTQEPARERAPTGKHEEEGWKERWKERWERDGEMGNSPGLFIRHITYSPNVPKYF